MPRLFPTLLLLAGLAFASSSVNAQSLTTSGLSAGTSVEPKPNELDSRGAVTITHSSSQAITTGAAVACGTTGTSFTSENSYYRAFNLSTFDITTPFEITNVSFGIESANHTAGTQTATLKFYTVATGTFPTGTLTQVGTGTPVTITTPAAAIILDVPVTGVTIPAGSTLVVELLSPDMRPNGGLYVGANAAPETGPTYLRAPTCGITTPATTASIGFPNMHWVLNVTGNDTPASGPSIVTNPTSVAFGDVVTNTTDSETVTVTNSGSAAATITSITATGPGFAVDLTGTDLTLDPAQSTTFAVTFNPTVAGAAAGSVSIVSNDPGSPDTVTLSGNGVPPGGPTTYPATGLPVAVPDNTTAGGPGSATSTITVPAGTGNVVDVDVMFQMTHTWTGDIIASLAHGATSVTFMDRPGVPASTNGCQGDNPNIIADDEGTAGTLEAGCTGTGTAVGYPVAGGRYTPNNPLSAFDGQAAAGTWTLTVSDNANGDTGSITAWALMITASGTVANEGGAQAANRLVVAPNPVGTTGQLSLRVATSQNVRVALYDMLGREVRVLFDGAIASGQEAQIGFRAADLQAGAYVVRATGENLSLTERVTITH